MQPSLSDIVKGSGVAGCAVGILRQGKGPEFTFHGACATGGEEIAPGFLWEAASLSKPVVALLAIEQIRDEATFLSQSLSIDPRSLGADDDARWAEVTPFHLLTHTSGLPNWRENGQQLGFESDPGTAGYSGEGYELLLTELSTRSGMLVGPMLDLHLARLGMLSSTFTPQDTTAAWVVVGRSESGSDVPKHHPAEAKASGSLHTTAMDYLRFLRHVARPYEAAEPHRSVEAKLVAERQTEVLPGYGRSLAWAFVESDLGDVLWQHGDNPGFKHVAAVRPSTGEALVVLTNDDNGQPLYRELCKGFFDIEVW